MHDAGMGELFFTGRGRARPGNKSKPLSVSFLFLTSGKEYHSQAGSTTISLQGGAGCERGPSLRGRAGPGLSWGKEHTAYNR